MSREWGRLCLSFLQEGEASSGKIQAVGEGSSAVPPFLPILEPVSDCGIQGESSSLLARAELRLRYLALGVVPAIFSLWGSQGWSGSPPGAGACYCCSLTADLSGHWLRKKRKRKRKEHKNYGFRAYL